MSSLVAFFHKHYNIQEKKFKAANRMRKEIRKIQAKTRNFHMPKCDKCGEFFSKKDLEHIDGINEDFCKTCTAMMRLARGDY